MNNALIASLTCTRLHLLLAIFLIIALLSPPGLAAQNFSADTQPTASAGSLPVGTEGVRALAPAAPLVTYENGLLTIRSNAAPLRVILEAVSAATGAALEVSGIDDRGPVVVDLGPAPPATVLASLLYGTSLNYAVVGAAGQPGHIEKILLLPRSAAPPVASAAPVAAEMTASASAESKPADESATASAEAESAKAEQPGSAGDKDENAKAEDESAAKDDKAEKDASSEDAESAKSEDGESADGKQTSEKSASNAGDTKQKTAKSDKPKSPEESATDAAAEEAPTPAFPAGLYGLYKGLFPAPADAGSAGLGSQSLASGGSASNLPAVLNGQTSVNGPGQLGAEIPVAGPTQFPPELWKLYPPNLLDLIKSGLSQPRPDPTPVVPVVSTGNPFGYLQDVLSKLSSLPPSGN